MSGQNPHLASPRARAFDAAGGVGSYIDNVNTMRFRKEFSKSSGVKKKTTERDVAASRAHVLSGHDEVVGMDITTELGAIAKGMVASAAGESDFVRTVSKEGLSSTDFRHQLILPATERKKFQDKDPETRPGSADNVSKWALTCVSFSKEAGALADNMNASLAPVQQIKNNDAPKSSTSGPKTPPPIEKHGNLLPLVEVNARRRRVRAATSLALLLFQACHDRMRYFGMSACSTHTWRVTMSVQSDPTS